MGFCGLWLASQVQHQTERGTYKGTNLQDTFRISNHLDNYKAPFYKEPGNKINL